MKTIILLLSLFYSTHLMANSNWGGTLSSEYTTLKSWIGQTNPDGIVGGLYPYIQMDGYKVLYSKDFDGKHETIRIFLAGKDNTKAFSITYIQSQYFEKGKLILRRFIGPEPTGWRMDAVDMKTLEYIESQGTKKPFLNKKAAQIIKDLGITVF